MSFRDIAVDQRRDHVVVTMPYRYVRNNHMILGIALMRSRRCTSVASSTVISGQARCSFGPMGRRHWPPSG
jgi:hypothetical protein